MALVLNQTATVVLVWLENLVAAKAHWALQS
jgi:hypothetical protein